MVKRILTGIILSILQVITYYLVFYTGWTLGRQLFSTSDMSSAEVIGFSHYFIYSLILFAIMITIGNLLIALINTELWSKRIFATMVVFSLIHWGQEFIRFPYKSILLLLSAFLAIFSRYLFVFIFEKWSKKVL